MVKKNRFKCIFVNFMSNVPTENVILSFSCWSVFGSVLCYFLFDSKKYDLVMDDDMPASSSKTSSRSRHRSDSEEEYGSSKVILILLR